MSFNIPIKDRLD
jgi:hypothetical protein